MTYCKLYFAVGGSIALKDYWEAGTIVFLFTTAEWLESRACHKVSLTLLKISIFSGYLTNYFLDLTFLLNL